MNNGVPTDLVAFLVGIACGLVLGFVFGRAFREHPAKRPPTPWWRLPNNPLAQRLGGYPGPDDTGPPS